MMLKRRGGCNLRPDFMSNTHFAIDQGNTRTKIGIFKGRELVQRIVCEGIHQDDDALKQLKEFGCESGILSSVRDERSGFAARLGEHVIVLNDGPALKMPFEMDYSTPETLGADRKANTAAFTTEFGRAGGLIVDCGTCITYTVVQSGKLLGGAISPGISMRYRALHHFTGKLPSYEPQFELPAVIGKSTEGSLRTGVELAVIGEVEKMITQYCSHINDLVVILTGGDMTFFERHVKSPIFARPLYTLTGLNEIFLFNTK